MNRLYTVCRFFVAFMALVYGFAKLNGAQFTILESELDKPMREVSGFWLTWYYFGYSALYGAFVAAVQIIPGIMLLFRKTTLLGSAILFGVIGNIILIDIAYRIDLGATPIDGRWAVVEVEPDSMAASMPSHLYFERNRAWMSVFRYDDVFDTNHFEVNASERTIGIWETWMGKGDRLFDGRYELQGDSALVLTGSLEGNSVDMTLQRMR